MIPLPRFSDGPAHEAGPEISATPLVQTIGLSKAFGTTTVLENVSLSIARNEFFTLLGPSGCGKTTLLRLIAGFEAPTAGRILLDGTDQIGLPPNRRPVNTVFQSYALFPHLTVRENVAFGLQRLRVPAAEARARVAEALTLVRLSDFASRKPAELSGGQQQRVALARAIAPRPLLLLLDEPLSALDLKLRRGMQAELKRLQRDTGITFVLVTHDQSEALSMSDRIAVINAGRVLQVGTPQDIYERPLTRFVADFIGEANVLPGTLVDSATTHVAIRPEHVLLDRAPSADTPYAATILDVTYGGSEITLNLRLDRGEAVTVALREMRPFLSPGAVVHCGFPPERLRDLED